MEQLSQVHKESVERSKSGKIARFMACKEGWKYLNRIRRNLTGATIVGVKFYPTNDTITAHLLLTEGDHFEFSIEVISLTTPGEQSAFVSHRCAVAARE